MRRSVIVVAVLVVLALVGVFGAFAVKPLSLNSSNVQYCVYINADTYSYSYGTGSSYVDIHNSDWSLGYAFYYSDKWSCNDWPAGTYTVTAYAIGTFQSWQTTGGISVTNPSSSSTTMNMVGAGTIAALYVGEPSPSPYSAGYSVTFQAINGGTSLGSGSTLQLVINNQQYVGVGGSIFLAAGTYSISTSGSSDVPVFGHWSTIGGVSVASSSSIQTTMTVTGDGTITFNAWVAGSAPTLDVAPKTVGPGQQMVFSGGGFSYSTSVTLYLDGSSVMTTATSNSLGGVGGELFMPKTLSVGTHSITAQDGASHVYSNAVQITVQSEQTTTAPLKATCWDVPNQHYISGVTVTVVSQSGTTYTKTTDSQGVADFGSLPTGSYTLTAHKLDYIDFTTQFDMFGMTIISANMYGKIEPPPLTVIATFWFKSAGQNDYTQVQQGSSITVISPVDFAVQIAQGTVSAVQITVDGTTHPMTMASSDNPYRYDVRLDLAPNTSHIIGFQYKAASTDPWGTLAMKTGSQPLTLWGSLTNEMILPASLILIAIIVAVVLVWRHRRR